MTRDLPLQVKFGAAALLPFAALVCTCLYIDSRPGHNPALLLGFCGLAGVAGVLLTLLTAKSVCSRIARLIECATLFASGIQIKNTDNSRDELGRLADAFTGASQVFGGREAEIAETSWKLQAVLRAASDVSIIAEDLQGRIAMFNHGAEKLLGYRSTEVIGQELSKVAYGESMLEKSPATDGLRAARRAALDNRPLDQATIYVRKDTTPLQVQLSVTPLKSVGGKITGLLHVAQDVTLHRALEADFRSANAQLKSQNEDAAVAARQLESTRDQLQNGVSQQLKNLQQALDVLLEDSPEQHMPVILRCREQAGRSLDLIDDLLH
jgi:PAS domain S-box-containing protein